MSMQEVYLAIKNVERNDPGSRANGFSDYAADKMHEVARRADITAPRVKKEIVVFSVEQTGQKIHFAFRAEAPDGRTMIFNLSEVPLIFPQFIGPFESAPGLLKKMTPLKKAA